MKCEGWSVKCGVWLEMRSVECGVCSLECGA